MFGNNNRDERNPKEIKESDRKIVSDSDFSSKPSKSTSDIETFLLIAGAISVIKFMWKHKFLSLILIVLFFLIFSETGIDYSDLEWGHIDFSYISDNVEPADMRKHTVMVYLNGTDLESKWGCATGDIQEMIDSNYNLDTVNVVILTGGTNSWKNEYVTAGKTMIHVIGEAGIKTLVDLDKACIADKNVLSAFVNYSMKAFPAEKYDLIFWNHGGGTIYGYGSDQHYQDVGMSILDIKESLAQTNLKNQKLEILGFDACLMATVETAYLLQDYSKYLVAAEELEPGDGWNYNFLYYLGENPSLSGAELGKTIVDTFSDFYTGTNEETTLSVIDLSKINNVVANLNSFAAPIKNNMNTNYNRISQARQNTKTFGYLGEWYGSYDLVDIYDLADKSASLVGTQSENLKKSVKDAVVYYRNSSNVTNSYGISTYLPYFSKYSAEESVDIYESLVRNEYSEFLRRYTEKLMGARVQRDSISKLTPTKSANNDSELTIRLSPKELEQINKIELTIWRQLDSSSDYFVRLGTSTDVNINPDGVITTMFDGYWVNINGEIACLHEVFNENGVEKYSTPAILNGQNVNLIITFDEQNPNGVIIGAIPEQENTNLAPKQYIKIKKGDLLTLKYYAQLFLENESDIEKYTTATKWVNGNKITVGDDLKIEVVPVDDELYMYSFCVTDTQNNEYYTKFIEIRY